MLTMMCDLRRRDEFFRPLSFHKMLRQGFGKIPKWLRIAIHQRKPLSHVEGMGDVINFATCSGSRFFAPGRTNCTLFDGTEPLHSSCTPETGELSAVHPSLLLFRDRTSLLPSDLGASL
jgi:hypothetical protein